MLLVMTVEPGFGGQSYIPESTERIRQARRMFAERGLDTDIQVDGGITVDNVHVALEAGANVIVAGSAIFGGDIGNNVRNMLGAFHKFEVGELGSWGKKSMPGFPAVCLSVRAGPIGASGI